MPSANPAKEIQPPKSQPPEGDGSGVEDDSREDLEDDFEGAAPSARERSRFTGTWIGRTMSFGASYHGNEPFLIAWPTDRDGSGSGGPPTAWDPRGTAIRRSR